MNPIGIRHTLIAALGVGLLVAGIYANEAEKEVRILCSMLQPGTSLAALERFLETAELLSVTSEVSGEYQHLEISSLFNLRLTLI